MAKLFSHKCPNCGESLDVMLSQSEDKIQESYICPSCKSTIAYKKYYPLLTIVFFGLTAVTLFAIVGCLLFKEACSSYSNYLLSFHALFLFLFALMLSTQNFRVITTPNKTLKQTV